MKYFAKIEENVVINILAVADDIEDGQNFLANTCNLGGTWIETRSTDNFRKQYATIGGTYDSENDVFIKPQPFPSWTLDSNHDWQAPVSKPEGMVTWNEATQAWEL